jgi:hypothetical protein
MIGSTPLSQLVWNLSKRCERLVWNLSKQSCNTRTALRLHPGPLILTREIYNDTNHPSYERRSFMMR